jgi:Tetratricopeptide repeat
MTIRLSPLDPSERSVLHVAVETTDLCPICGQPNPASAKQCAACGITFLAAPSTEKVDAILEDLLDLSNAPPDAASAAPPDEDSPEVDETSAEQLFDSLLLEVQPSPDDATSEAVDGSSVVEGAEAARAGEDVGQIPVLATPAETEGRKFLRMSGRMLDAVTLASVGALLAVFVFFRMYVNLFDPSHPIPSLLFAGIAVGGMAAALGLFRLSNSEVAQGDRLVKQGRYAEALPHYERAIRIVRRPSYAWTSRGVAMKYLGRLDEALRCHENAIRLDSANEVAWCNLGTVYFRKNQLGKALDCYDKAIKIHPRYAIAWNNKGVVLSRMGRFEDADRCHAKATKLRPEYVAAWLNRGEVLARLGDRAEAEKCLERARTISRGASA